MAEQQETYVTAAEVKELLTEAAEKRGGMDELIQVQRGTLDNLSATCRIDKEAAEKIVNECMDKLDFIDNKTAKKRIAYKIADILPKYPNDVVAIFYKERIQYSDEDVQTILDIVKNNA